MKQRWDDPSNECMMSPHISEFPDHPSSYLPGCLPFSRVCLNMGDLQNPLVNHHVSSFCPGPRGLWMVNPPMFGQTHIIGTPKRRHCGHFGAPSRPTPGRATTGHRKKTQWNEFSGAVPRRKSRLPHSACDKPRVHEVRDKRKLSRKLAGT